MAINKEVWAQDIVEQLREPSDFTTYAEDHDALVVEGSLVHVPMVLASPAVARNRTVFPAPVTTRADASATYNLSAFSTDPIVVRHIERFELSYDKRLSVMGAQLAVLRERIATELLRLWIDGEEGDSPLPATGVLDTTGGNNGNSRRRLLLNDLLTLKERMDEARLPQEGRMLLLTPEMHRDLFTIPEMLTAEAVARQAFSQGVVAQVLGFQVLVRGALPRYTAAGALKALADPRLVTDRLASVAWSRFAVARAIGEVAFFEAADDPQHYGSVYSALVRAGGLRLRNDGVYVLRQGTI